MYWNHSVSGHPPPRLIEQERDGDQQRNDAASNPPFVEFHSSFLFTLDDEEDKEESTSSYHDASLVSFLCDRLQVSPSSILDFELFLYDLNVPFLLSSPPAGAHRRSEAGICDGSRSGQSRVQFLRLGGLSPGRKTPGRAKCAVGQIPAGDEKRVGFVR